MPTPYFADTKPDWSNMLKSSIGRDLIWSPDLRAAWAHSQGYKCNMSLLEPYEEA